jgi:hypothetical protein
LEAILTRNNNNNNNNNNSMLPKLPPHKKSTEWPVANGEKRLRKKKKNPAEDDGDNDNDNDVKPSNTTGKIKLIKKGKKTVAEIDGELYAVDANGRPTKKLRKKKKAGEDDDAPPEQRPNGTPMRQPMRLRPSTEGVRYKRSHSAGPAGEDRWERPDRTRSAPQREKSIETTPSTFVDAKGREVVVDEFGNKTVFDKSGKKLRKKGEKEEKKRASALLVDGSKTLFDKTGKKLRKKGEKEEKKLASALRIDGGKTVSFFMVSDGVVHSVADGLYHVTNGLVTLY